MCGIAGIFAPQSGHSGEDLGRTVAAMTHCLTHRGPDAAGLWIDPEVGIGLGHRRLSVLDLSAAGAQPMVSRDGRYVIVFNGEIYNFPDLRREIEQRRGSVTWRGCSDTEVLLELIADVGVETAVAACDGMLAIALWDRQAHTLTLARDAFGEKPLYYGWGQGGLLFASELRAFEASGKFRSEIDAQALASYFSYGYIPSPLTIWTQARKLPPASLVTFTADGVRAQHAEPRLYWDAAESALSARAAPFTGTVEEAERHTEAILLESVRRRLVSDVPLGALLSGGVDSSLVTSLMQKASPRPVRTFSIGMDAAGYNEAGHARDVAAAIGTAHTELILSPEDVRAAVPLMPQIYDEPFADSSQIPTYLVSRMARRDVTVALSGDGGDELFGGYNRHFQAPRIWNRVGRLPVTARNVMAAGLAHTPAWAIEAAGGLVSRELRAGRSVEKVRKLARVMAAGSEVAFHDNLLAISADAQRCLTSSALPVRLTDQLPGDFASAPLAERAMLLDTRSYMPDDVLTKVDRASMAVSLEVRTPFLNRDLFAFAWGLPAELKMSGGEGKRILRRILERHVPRTLVDRPKAGFAIPVGPWLRSGLRDWAEAQLAPDRLGVTGLLDVGEVRRRWQSHLSGRSDEDALIWSVLMFQGWVDVRGGAAVC